MRTALAMPPPGFDELTLEEKLDYLQALWERMSAHPEDVPRKLVRERLAALERGEGATVPWSAVRREAEDLLRKASEEETRPSDEEKRLDAIYDILEAGFESGEVDVAARHDEHQP